ncbi:MAG: 4-hydroxy-3-methylbut-2-enyl diphosphate reductase [Clostridia bacterium]|nr:4-hydroxy-3-methylbut-2-enyl diphosphate reductase [Clostridia bacterium]
MVIEVDKDAGFCSGVARAIRLAEQELSQHGQLYSLGAIIHNEAETHRLEKLGMRVIGQQQFAALKDAAVLIRAHGEPPATYEIARQNNLRLIDATCPVVLRLQQKVKQAHQKPEVQVVIFGRKNHPEVIGLNGQTGNQAIIIETEADLQQINFTRPIHLFAQTTQNRQLYRHFTERIAEAGNEIIDADMLHFEATDSICRQVSDRDSRMAQFAKAHDVVIFVSGASSSNGKYLCGICRENNAKTFQVATIEEIKSAWFAGAKKVGITGATSTPLWLLRQAAEHIKTISQNTPTSDVS